MSLVKLWKSLRGRSKEHSTAEKSSVSDPSVGVSEISSSTGEMTSGISSMAMPSKRVPSKQVPANQLSDKKATSKKAAPKRRLFGGGPHAGLCRQLKGLEIESVLEISVDDGTRALAVLEVLQKKCLQPVRYAAIDEFELGGSTFGLRDFYCLLREHDVRPQLFPEKVDNGLRNVANNLGAMDLVLIATTADRWQNPVTLHLLSRITHPDTLILHYENDAWVRFQPETGTLRRAA
ncbi:MAG: hypothetical protein GY904_18920 [Planctomycetaceae bacterium]|nr:hypothetical protein [Planctomycetaceae bacterium]